MVTKSRFKANLQEILRKGAASPRYVAELLSKDLKIPYWIITDLLGTFLRHEVPEDDSGTVELNGSWVILNIPGVAEDYHVPLTT